jgi:hypothetical protein
LFGSVVILQQHVLTKIKNHVQYTQFFKKLSVILFPNGVVVAQQTLTLLV